MFYINEYYKTIEVSGIGEMCSYDNENDYQWNVYKDDVKEIHIDGGVTTISKNAFKGFTKLEKVYIPESVKIIESGAFEGCKALKYVRYCGEQDVEFLENSFAGVSGCNVDVPRNYGDKTFCGMKVSKRLNDQCYVSSKNSAGSTSVLSTALGVATAVLMMNNHRNMP